MTGGAKAGLAGYAGGIDSRRHEANTGNDILDAFCRRHHAPDPIPCPCRRRRRRHPGRRFVVSKPPQPEGGKWKMTVDGVELTRDE